VLPTANVPVSKAKAAFACHDLVSEGKLHLFSYLLIQGEGCRPHFSGGELPGSIEEEHVG
jgi:hypothetical protein